MGALGDLGLLILAYWPWVLAGVVAIIGAIVYVLNKEFLDFWWLNAKYGFPVVGKLTRLSRRVAPAGNEYDGWLQSEVTLGTDYKQHIKFLSEAEFKK